MNQKPRIRIIKPAARRQPSEARGESRESSVSRLAQAKALASATIITEWIGDLRRQKQQGNKAERSFESLFSETA